MNTRPTYISLTDNSYHYESCFHEFENELGYYDELARVICLRRHHPEVVKARSSEKALIKLAKRINEAIGTYALGDGVLRCDDTDNIKHPPCKKCGDPVTVAAWQYDRVCQSCLTALRKEPTPKNLSTPGRQNERVDSTQMFFDFSSNEKSLRALDL